MADYDAQPDRSAPAEPELSMTQLEADESDLHAGLTGLAGITAGGRAVIDLLGDVAEFAAQAIPGVDGAGVTLVQTSHGTPRPEAWAATAQFVREIDAIQYESLHEGPCITCMQSRRPTVSGSLGSDRRWPHFGGRVARMGVHSALALPLLMDDQVIGTINSYAYARDAFAEHAVQLGAQFAGPAAVSVYNAQLLTQARDRAEQLQRALGSRTVIDQAIGIMRSRTGGSAEDAFDRLTQISQADNVKLRVIAERLVEEAVKRARARRQGP
ncbi:GAF and ANTAR domain-containing protein [Mycolicibacterium stellerae]|uniref:GAF and ANTAR domain-containing protein n=1 Tax=Mycolicibacterium stellerae TaxID=2358193 RepID=UPI000F0BCB40|nr:GAF and ANTAR domain-containing protein [Mycolicibacterium stellerae]